MPDYAKAVIYKIMHDDHPGQCYIGSTTQTLADRISSHRRRASSDPAPVHKFFNETGWDKVRITAVEEFACEHKDALLSRERYWIEKIGTLNKNVPGRKMDEYHKFYYATHKAVVNEKYRVYYHANRESICERRRMRRAALASN